MRLEVADYLDFLPTISEADLVLTDPPYGLSEKGSKAGFQSVGAKGVARLAVNMDFGEWDKQPIDLPKLSQLAFQALRKGGTAIIFYDLWKLSYLAEALSNAGFAQIRLIIWRKTNPVPLNSKRNYLTNSREIAVLGVKGSNPTFHSEYDDGVYAYSIPNRHRYHPTQKPIKLFAELIRKHSNEGDLIVDPFLGSGTTAIAALQEGRRFAGCDIDSTYIQIAKERINNGSRRTSKLGFASTGTSEPG